MQNLDSFIIIIITSGIQTPFFFYTCGINYDASIIYCYFDRFMSMLFIPELQGVGSVAQMD